MRRHSVALASVFAGGGVRAGGSNNKLMVEKIYLAKPRGYCAGVVMAIKAVEQAAQEMKASDQGEVAVYHSIVHNNAVVQRLQQDHGVHFLEDLEEVQNLEKRIGNKGGKFSGTVVFSAHGVSPVVKQKAEELDLAIIDATCPLVTKVHNEAKKCAKLGYHILLIGDSTQHQEVIGTRGQAPEQTTVVSVVDNRKHDLELADPHTVTVPDPGKVVALTQTTLSVDDTTKTIQILKKRFPEMVILARDDLCYATKNRQDAVRRNGDKIDLYLVVTSNYSSNGMRLFELADELSGNAKRIETVKDIEITWLEGVRSVGITSAASTPDDLVQAIVRFFQIRNPEVEIIEEAEWENITFRQPKRMPPRAVSSN